MLGKRKKDEKKGKVSLKVLTPEGYEEAFTKAVVSPEIVETEKGFVRVNDLYIIPCVISAYPARAVAGWIAEEFGWKNYYFDLSMFIEPTDESRAVNILNRKITKLEATLRDLKEKGKIDTEAIEKELEYLYYYKDKLVSRKTRLFKIATYFYLASDEKNVLESHYKDFYNKMKGKGCQLKRIRYKVLEALRTLLPEGTDWVQAPRILADSEAVASCFPFTFPTLVHDTGVLYGFDASTSYPIIVDRFNFAGHNEIIVGEIGSGKSFFAKLEALRWYFNDPKVKIFIVDPLAGYRDLALLLEANWIRVGKDIVNPMDVFIPPESKPEEILRDKLLSLLEFFSTFFEETIGSPLDKTESGVLRKAIMQAYKKKNYENVIIDDVINELDEVAVGDEEKKASERIKSAMEAFRAELSTFNGLTNVNINSRVVYFDFSAVEGVEKAPLYLHSVLAWIGSRVRGEMGKKIVIVDEAHYFLSYKQIRLFLERSIRHSRHHKTGYTLITQGYSELLETNEGRTIIQNSDIHVIFRQKTLPEDLKKMLSLPSTAEEFVKNAAQGKVAGYSSALLVTPQGKFYIHVHASPEEVELLSLAGRGV